MRIAPNDNRTRPVRAEDGSRRRVWSETVPMAQLREAALLRSLAARGVELVAAVRPGQQDDAVALVRACGDAGVRVLVWPMLADADGRWASTANAEVFVRFAIELLDALERE